VIDLNVGVLLNATAAILLHAGDSVASARSGLSLNRFLRWQHECAQTQCALDKFTQNPLLDSCDRAGRRSDRGLEIPRRQACRFDSGPGIKSKKPSLVNQGRLFLLA